jgi:hypothetical protein
MAASIKRSAASLLALAAMAMAAACGGARAQDPFASNNGFYPPGDLNPPLTGPYRYRQLSHNYPSSPPSHSWLDAKSRGPITVDNASDYMTRLKAYVEPTIRKMIEAPSEWDPASNGWYDMPWMGFAGPGGPEIASEDGRESLLGSFTGQIVLKTSEAHGELMVDTQNHTVIYYDPMAASTLGDIWKNVYAPNKAAASYREGSLVVKAGGVAATPEEWPEVDGAAIWRVYRPPVGQVIAHRVRGSSAPYTPKVTDLRVMQFDIIVKDTDAAPETGWVFTTFVYDKDAPKGTGAWDQLVPLGATWGNDPEFDSNYLGHPPGDPNDPSAAHLKQFWRNPKAPKYTLATLGWGGRMSGPIDIAERHGVLLVKDDIAPGKIVADADCSLVPSRPISGPFRASGCLSCHGTAQTGSGARMYPSPVDAHLPSDGQPFCLYTPGTPSWAQWFQNRPGRVPQRPTPNASFVNMVAAAAAAPAPMATRAFPFLRFASDGRPVTMAQIQKAIEEPAQGLDYDMLLMFALSTAGAEVNGVTAIHERQAVH